MNQPITKRRRLFRLSLLLGINLLVIALVAAVAIVYGWSSFANRLPTLRGWHKDLPKSEFRASDEKPGFTFTEYLAREEAVFRELADFETSRWASEKVGPYCRFQAGSICRPDAIAERNWNRTFVLESEKPAAGVLLVHGLSDAPYSLRTLGLRLHEAGCTVIGLRVPGHGTCPAALAHITAEDWTAAVRIAMLGLRDRVPKGTPLIMVGYSNGGALCVHYAAGALSNPQQPRPDGLVLFSPMIGITPLAELTELYPAVSSLSGQPKLAWSGIEPEIDPFKYSSWPINASLQGYRMTRKVEEALAPIAAAGRMAEFPPVLAMQSAADATVLVDRLIDGLMDRLAPGRGELILFDINRGSKLKGLVEKDYEQTLLTRIERGNLPFALTLVTNKNADTMDLVARAFHDGASTDVPLGIAWPPHVFSLSHVALPIPPDDPTYGVDLSDRKLPLGTMSARGERGVMTISEGLLMRMRNNPCYDWMQGRVVEWIERVAAKTPGEWR